MLGLWKWLVSESRVVCCIILGGLEYSLHQVEILCGDTERGHSSFFACFFSRMLLRKQDYFVYFYYTLRFSQSFVVSIRIAKLPE